MHLKMHWAAALHSLTIQGLISPFVPIPAAAFRAVFDIFPVPFPLFPPWEFQPTGDAVLSGQIVFLNSLGKLNMVNGLAIIDVVFWHEHVTAHVLGSQLLWREESALHLMELRLRVPGVNVSRVLWQDRSSIAIKMVNKRLSWSI